MRTLMGRRRSSGFTGLRCSSAVPLIAALGSKQGSEESSQRSVMSASVRRLPLNAAVTSTMPEPTPHADLLHFNAQLLDQAVKIVAAHFAPEGPAYAGPVGSHLRHVIEHYEALLFGARAGVVDYDNRPRYALLERSARIADARLRALQVRLRAHDGGDAARPLQVLGRFGLRGEFEFVVPSSLDRELAFLASHTVHHFALLLPLLQPRGIALGEHFGKAPATVAHALAAASLRSSTPLKETACHTVSTASL
jgi:hypothetical protein